MTWFQRLFRKPRRSPILRQRRHPPLVEALEDRLVMTGGIVVTTASDVVDADDGLISLREALDLANSDPDVSSITFGNGAALPGGTDFTDNTPHTITLGDDGELDIYTALSITGPGANRLTISGNDSSRIFTIDDEHFDTSLAVSLTGLTLAHGASGRFDDGGAVFTRENLTITNCILSDNAGEEGGALYSEGTTTIHSSTFISNRATGNGNGDGDGGAIENQGALTVTDSTFFDNQAFDEGGAIDNTGPATFVNCTVAYNSAGNDGGGINNQDSLTVVNSTIVGNRADSDGNGTEGSGSGGIRTDDSRGLAFLFNTIVASNQLGLDGESAADLSVAVPGQIGVDPSSSNNLIGDAATAAELTNGDHGNIVGASVTDIFVTDAGGAPRLADNGGPTQTIALIAGSPAINDGSDAHATVDGQVGSTPLDFDQRGDGFDRFVGTVDIGAFEAAPTLDFGDAPTGYPVTLAEDGARHVARGPTLGATRDAEADGAHSASADADGADEDGVTAAGPLVVGQTTNITINVQGGAGFVNAWADLNRDGDWNDLGEQFLDNLPVTVGDNVVPFAVPANFPLGPVFVRYRLTSQSVDAPTPTGFLPDGEVEDYRGAIVETPSLVVTTADDVANPFDGLTSLREAIAYANSKDGSDEITFASALDGTPIHFAGEFTITDGVTITGNGQAETVIDAQQASRIFHITDTAGDVLLQNLTLENGQTTARDEEGGAILSAATATLSFANCTVSGNSTQGTNANGGALAADNGTVTVVNSTFSGNSASSFGAAGGAIAAQDVLIQSSTFTNNTAKDAGGAIWVSGESATIVGSTFSGNTVTRGVGGAIYASDGDLAFRVQDCTFNGNNSSGNGGAIYVQTDTTVSIVNSTFSDNTSGGDGGALYAYTDHGPARLSIVNTTITGNHAEVTGGGFEARDFATVIQNSIIAGNTTDEFGPEDVRVAGSDSSLAVFHSFIGINVDTSLTETGTAAPDANGNYVGGDVGGVIDPLLGPLKDNGGPTLTHALLAGSLAINTGDNALAETPGDDNQPGTDDDNEAALANDQRGPDFVRIIGGTVDMGAFESDTVPVAPDLDFGDAPTGYPVTLAEDGARHVATGPTLGATRTSEADGTHSTDASADTGDDGVTAAGLLIVGQTTNITISVQGGDGYVNAWADLNRDGDWDDLGEQFLTNQYVDGDITIPFAVPANFTPGDINVRYRLTSASVETPSPTGLLPDGEVEDYVATIYGADFGDAPDGYLVTLAENGAEHLAIGPTLGATRTSEADGTHSADASADIGDDGVTAAGPLIVGQTTNITISVQGGDGYVNAWADLNRDGDWDDLGEQFLTNQYVDGDITIPFAVPANFTPGDINVRYRLTSASVASPSPTGLLPDGEVEDYVATIVESRTFTPFSDITVPYTQDKVSLDLAPGASDAFRAAGSQAYFLDQDANLEFFVDLYQNYGDANEKWVRSGTTGAWYFIKPSGDVFLWDLTPEAATGTFVVHLDPVYWDSPDLLYEATPELLPYVLDQRFGLHVEGGYSENFGGRGEKWLRGGDGTWYFIDALGDFYRSDGIFQETDLVTNRAGGTLLAHLGTYYLAHPELLYQAFDDAMTFASQVSVQRVGDELIVDPIPAKFENRVAIDLKVTQNDVTSDNQFNVFFVNHTPVVDPIVDQTMTARDGQKTVDLSGSDADADTTSFSAVAGSLGYVLDQLLGLRIGTWANVDSYFWYNWGGENEKWLQSRDNQWYCIKPNGELVRWDHRVFAATGEVIATLDTQFYDHIELLYDAALLPGVGVNVTGSTLTITPPPNDARDIWVGILLSDANRPGYKFFKLQVTA